MPKLSWSSYAIFPDWTRRLGGWHGKQVIFAVGLFGVAFPVYKYLHTDYRRWYNLEKGGLPHNAVGYVLAKILTQFGDSDVNSTLRYVKEGDLYELEGTSFFDEAIPVRAGPRPNISRWAAPVRQLSAKSPEAVKQKLLGAIREVAVGFPVDVSSSHIEGGTHGGNALHVASNSTDPRRRSASLGPFEIYHVHPTDGSAHAIVSAIDAKILIESGWSERHILSGANIGGFPSTYVHIYAPRTDEEVYVHLVVAKAATRYALMKDMPTSLDTGK